MSWDSRQSQANPTGMRCTVNLPFDVLLYIYYLREVISMDRDENPMNDMIGTCTVESPGVSPPSTLITPPPLSCAFSPLPYPSTPGVAQSILQVTGVEAG